MSTDNLIIGLYIRVDEFMRDEPKHPQAGLHPKRDRDARLALCAQRDGPASVLPLAA
jgi:hypothetical protein